VQHGAEQRRVGTGAETEEEVCRAAVGVTRGSATMSLAPLSRARQIQLVVIGAHSAMLAPTTNTTPASGMSLHGFAARPIPRARLFATPADTMQSRPL
jgi:hypothetical protein